jgi:hypothetical protein
VREAADEERIRRLAEELGRRAPRGTRLYLTGGATAVLEGWRPSTVDVDIRVRRAIHEELGPERLTQAGELGVLRIMARFDPWFLSLLAGVSV